MYQYINTNPHYRHIDDCTIRALSILTDKTWRETQEELSRIANRDGYMIDDVVFVEDYLDDRYKRECHYSKTVGEFAEEFPYGRYAVTMNGHITAIIDGVIYDTFNPSNRIMRCAWKIK